MVETDGCPCCARAVPAPWSLVVTPWRMYRQWRPDGQRPTWTLPLCAECSEWLGGLVAAARGDRPSNALFGSPASGSRKLVFDDQCHICFELPYGRAARIAWVDPDGRRLEMFACDACEAWLASLASDGHTLRGTGDRQIDGPYGFWPHPNLRGVAISFDIMDGATLAAAREACAAMGMREAAANARIHLVEAGRPRRNQAPNAPSPLTAPSTVVLAGPRSRRELAVALEAGAQAWSTIPSTPQQLTACFAAVLRGGASRAWDGSTCLPIAAPAESPRPVLICRPLSGIEPWDVAWLLRRFCRGYDQLSWLDNRILISPRVADDAVELVGARLRPLLAGRATLEVVAAEHLPQLPRLDVAG